MTYLKRWGTVLMLEVLLGSAVPSLAQTGEEPLVAVLDLVGEGVSSLETSALAEGLRARLLRHKGS